MKNFIVRSSWSRKTIGAIFIATAACMVACDDSSSASADANDELVSVESSSSAKSSSSGRVAEPVEVISSSSEKAKSSSSKDEKETKVSSNSVKSSSSSSVIPGNDPESSSSEKSSSSSELVKLLSSSSGIIDDSEYDEFANTLKDLRDGNIYATTTITVPSKNYSQVWMAENLNFKTENSFCYNDSADYCAKYGRLYTWAAAINSIAFTGRTRGICPSGWHLPEKKEFEELVTAVTGALPVFGGSYAAGKVLKSQSGWFNDGNGSDSFGFSALPAGCRYTSRGNFYYIGSDTGIWSSTEFESNNSYAHGLFLHYDDKDGSLSKGNKTFAYSVRCVKDE